MGAGRCANDHSVSFVSVLRAVIRTAHAAMRLHFGLGVGVFPAALHTEITVRLDNFNEEPPFV
jgi:hypothetical protein